MITENSFKDLVGKNNTLDFEQLLIRCFSYFMTMAGTKVRGEALSKHYSSIVAVSAIIVSKHKVVNIITQEKDINWPLLYRDRGLVKLRKRCFDLLLHLIMTWQAIPCVIDQEKEKKRPNGY